MNLDLRWEPESFQLLDDFLNKNFFWVYKKNLNLNKNELKNKKYIRNLKIFSNKNASKYLDINLWDLSMLNLGFLNSKIFLFKKCDWLNNFYNIYISLYYLKIKNLDPFLLRKSSTTPVYNSIIYLVIKKRYNILYNNILYLNINKKDINKRIISKNNEGQSLCNIDIFTLHKLIYKPVVDEDFYGNIKGTQIYDMSLDFYFYKFWDKFILKLNNKINFLNIINKYLYGYDYNKILDKKLFLGFYTREYLINTRLLNKNIKYYWLYWKNIIEFYQQRSIWELFSRLHYKKLNFYKRLKLLKDNIFSFNLKKKYSTKDLERNIILIYPGVCNKLSLKKIITDRIFIPLIWLKKYPNLFKEKIYNLNLNSTYFFDVIGFEDFNIPKMKTIFNPKYNYPIIYNKWPFIYKFINLFNIIDLKEKFKSFFFFFQN